MKGDFSRLTFRPLQGYTRVNKQMGRVELESDWNEQQAIHDYLRTTRGEDIIGLCGTPAYSHNGFNLQQQGGEWQISAGHFYVDGILCVNEQNRALSDQPFPYDQIPDLNASPNGMVYLDVWQRHVSAQQDTHIRETALNGADTATRTQTVWQVKFLPVANLPDTDILLDQLRNQVTLSIPEWVALIEEPTGTLSARTNPAAVSETPCELPPNAGFWGLESYLYRVEIHHEGVTPTFKWSRNNASFAVAVESMPSNQSLVVASTGRDELLSFQQGAWIELIGNPEIYSNQPGELAQIDQVNLDTRTITVTNMLTQHTDDDLATGRYLLRIWDQSGETATQTGIVLNNDWITLENGIQVQFSLGSYQSGDYWMIPSRTNTGQIEWPPYNAIASANNAAPRLGVTHHYCPLALLENGTLLDLRLMFPPLNHITAQDVHFDNRNCGAAMADSDTVQQALEILCRQNRGHCTLHLGPTDNLQTILSALPDDVDARICLDVGTYEISETLELENKGHLIFVGAGFGTRLIAQELESVLTFNNCASVTIEDLSLRASSASSSNALNGPLTFIGCRQVTVERVVLQCGAGLRRMATCLTVRNTEEQIRHDDHFGIVRIHHCHFNVGHLQTGILLVNVAHTSVENNIMQVVELPPEFRFSEVIRNSSIRKRIRRLLISNFAVDSQQDVPAIVTRRNNSATNVSLDIGGETVRFLAPPALSNSTLWEQALRRRPEVISEDTRRTIYALAESILQDTSGLNTTFNRWLRQAEQDDGAVIGQGIVIGGTIANDIKIHNNTFDCVLQGIHIGVSHHDPSRREVDSIGTANVSNNIINICLPTTSVAERHGILIGNCTSVVLRDNHISLQRFDSTSSLRVEAIRLFGYFGKRMIVQHNYTEGAGNFIGIRVTPIDEQAPARPVWVVSNNVAFVETTDNRILRENNAA